MSHVHSIIDILRERGFRLTNARRHIAGCFSGACDPLAATDILASLIRKRVHVNATTIYRELNFLAEQGLVRTIQFQDGVQRYELASLPHHHHLVCQSCKKVEHIELEDDLHHIEQHIKRTKRFSVQQHSLEFYGHCSKCA